MEKSQKYPASARFPRRHLLTCEGLTASDINFLLDIADANADANARRDKKRDVLAGRTLINLFFESSTRTQSSFELAGKRLGADVMNMNVATSSVTKGETLIDTAVTLNAMRPDIIVVRHHAAGAGELLSQKVDCSARVERLPEHALVMHPGPMNRGVEIASTVADDPRSVIREQVEMGVAVRMAVLEAVSAHLPEIGGCA